MEVDRLKEEDSIVYAAPIRLVCVVVGKLQARRKSLTDIIEYFLPFKGEWGKKEKL
jgi:hypothetical protein